MIGGAEFFMQAILNMPIVSLLSDGNPHQTGIDECRKCAQLCE